MVVLENTSRIHNLVVCTLCSCYPWMVLGLPPIDLHGPLHWVGIMDPLCGGTRAARYTAIGQWGQAWHYNPLGIVTVLAVGLLLLRGAVGVTTGRWPVMVANSPTALSITLIFPTASPSPMLMTTFTGRGTWKTFLYPNRFRRAGTISRWYRSRSLGGTAGAAGAFGAGPGAFSLFFFALSAIFNPPPPRTVYRPAPFFRRRGNCARCEPAGHNGYRRP